MTAKPQTTDAQPLAPRERITLDAKDIGFTLKLSPEELADIAEECRPRKKVSYVGVPAIFNLELECKHLNAAFGGFGCYLVGSAIERADWRDVDVVFIMEDEEFAKLFPGVASHSTYEFDPRWLILTVSISERLSRITGLPIDFKFQPQTHANARHKGPRHALGLNIVKD